MFVYKIRVFHVLYRTETNFQPTSSEKADQTDDKTSVDDNISIEETELQ